jgi:hypothetical protein
MGGGSLQKRRSLKFSRETDLSLIVSHQDSQARIVCHDIPLCSMFSLLSTSYRLSYILLPDSQLTQPNLGPHYLSKYPVIFSWPSILVSCVVTSLLYWVLRASQTRTRGNKKTSRAVSATRRSSKLARFHAFHYTMVLTVRLSPRCRRAFMLSPLEFGGIT